MKQKQHTEIVKMMMMMMMMMMTTTTTMMMMMMMMMIVLSIPIFTFYFRGVITSNNLENLFKNYFG